MLDQRKLALLWNRLCLLLFAVMAAWPIWVALITSFKTGVDLLRTSQLGLDNFPSFTNYQSVLGGQSFRHSLMTSIIVSFLSSSIALPLSLPMAYVSSRFMKRKVWLRTAILITCVMPPIFLALTVYGSYSTVLNYLSNPLIIIYPALQIPVIFLILEARIRQLDIAIDESIVIDGGTILDVILYGIVPEIRGSMLVALVLAVWIAFSDYSFALVMGSDQNITITMWFATLHTGDVFEWGPLTAAFISICVFVYILTFAFLSHLDALTRED